MTFVRLVCCAPILLFATPLAAQRVDAPPAVKRYFELVRPLFSGQRAFDQVAFMDRYFRSPGNEGFNASIRRVEETLKAAGYVEEKTAKPGDALTYRIERRPMTRPAWEPADGTYARAASCAPAAACVAFNVPRAEPVAATAFRSRAG